MTALVAVRTAHAPHAGFIWCCPKCAAAFFAALRAEQPQRYEEWMQLAMETRA
jgi:hypothetical protein